MLPLLGSKFFLYDVGYKNEHYGDSLKIAIQELIGNQSLAMVGAIFCHSQPGLECLISEKIIAETKAVFSANFDPSVYLKSAACKELSRMPLDHPNSIAEDKEFFHGLNLCFHFNPKHPLVKYSISQQEEKTRGDEKQLQINRGEKHMLMNGDSKNSIDCSDDTENNVLLHIKPSLSTIHPSVLVTGNTPVAQIGKLIDSIGIGSLSVFVVPHHESKECLSLLPEDTRKQLSNPVSLNNAALHLALYHMRESFHPSVSKLKGTKLEESGKGFLTYYLHHCNPEDNLAEMLQDPEAKVSSIFQSEKKFQLNWYEEHKQRVFSELMKAVSEEEGKQWKRITFFRDSLAWANFYKHVHAEVYLMSAEDLKQEVLNGIIIANIWRKTKCCILVTDSLHCSLNEVIQRDVRKLAFPAHHKSEPIIRLGFLDKNYTRSVPFFTINPWSQAQHHTSKYHTVSIDTVKHTVSGLGDERLLHLIKDELDVMELISTKCSNTIIGHIAQSHRPELSKAKANNEFKHLETYLKLIGYKSKSYYGVDEVLNCLIGPSLVHQLRNIDSKENPNTKIIPALLEQKTSGNSKFILTPTTNSSASEAKIDVYISRSSPLLVEDKKVTNATFVVKKAKTMSVDITLNVNKSIHIKVSKYLNLKGSCGKTVADHIYGICCKEDAWFPAKKLTVGELLHIFLKERALMAIQSLPLFLSFPLSKCKINHYLTTVNVDSSQTLQEAHIYVNPFDLLPVSLNNCKLLVHVKSLTMHVFSLCDVDQHMIQIEGVCTVNRMSMRFSCSSSPDLQKHVRFFFAEDLSATEVFEFIGIYTPPESLTHPISSGKLKFSYEAGFMLSQLFDSTEEASLTSLFFVTEFCSEIEHLLPPALDHIQHANVKTVLHFPSVATPKLGLEVSFISKLKAPEMESVMLECCLSVSPSVTDNSFTHEVTIRQYSNQNESQEFKGMSIYAIISALNGTLGKDIIEQLQEIPKVGNQILNNMTLRKIVLQLMNREIQVLELHATLSELDIIPGKLSAKDCTLKITYSKDGLELECSGSLVFLRHYKYLVQFSLPTVGKKGKLSFRSYNDDLLLKDLMQEFGWLSCDVISNPILANVLDVAVRKVALDFHFTPKDNTLQITASDISIFKERLDINLMTFHGIELDVSLKLVDDHYVTAFSLKAYISDALYAELKYNPDSHVLTGKIRVTFSKSVSAIDVLQIFKSPTSSYDNMKCILKEEFIDVFNSDLKISTQPGLTACLSISISLSPKHSEHYSLEHLNLEVEDVLKICCKKIYVLNNFQFEYFNKKLHNKDVAATSHLSLVVHQLDSKKNMILNFDFVSKQCQDNTSFCTAKVEAGSQGGFLKLSSAIDLAQAAVPELPKFDVGLPPIFDIELLSGFITFTLRPSFKPSAFDINILISEWQIFDDPELTVHKLTLKTTWKSGNYPQLSFTDCSLNFLGHELKLNGRLTSEEVYIECSSAEKLPVSVPTHFKSILEDYTPNSQPKPILPNNIGLPPMEVKLKELIIQLKERERKFRINTGVVCRSPWMIEFGSHIIPVHNLGGALEWEKLKNVTSYKAFLYGTIELFDMQVEMEILLGKNIDSIVSAAISTQQRLPYSQVADHLLCSEAVIPYEQYDPSSSGLSALVPSTMQDISLTSASAALNVTRKQFYISSEVQGWGTGALLIGYLVSKDEMDYVVSLSLNQDFRFGRLSESLSFVDELLSLRSMDVLISSADLQSLSDLTQFCQSFSQSHVHEQLQKPFYESKILNSSRLAEYGIRVGTTIYAEIDVTKSKGDINKLLELGDRAFLKDDLSIMTYIGTSKTTKHLEVHAWIPRILLFEMLEFSSIHLMYRVKTASEFELTGTVALHLELNKNKPLLKFDGKLSVNPTFAEFSTNSCRDIVAQPFGIHVKVNDLKLALKMYLNGESPDVFVSGTLEIGSILLTCQFLLKGVTFKVFMIRLGSQLMLSALFYCIDVDWCVELDIGIKTGQFYYATSNITFEVGGTLFQHEEGYHLEAVITLLNSDFRIKADISSDRSDMVLSGRSIEPIDFGFAKITGERPYTHEGPEIKYRGSEKSLALRIGVEILRHPCFEGELKYKFQDKSLEGTIRYPGRFLWIDEPSMTVKWSKDDGFKIVDFSLWGDVPGFSFLGAVAKFAKVIYNLIKGILSYSVKLHLKTDKNPDPKKHLVKLVFYGEFVVTVIGFNLPIFPLPELPILLPRVDDFSFAKLPEYILKCLWNSAGPICRSLLDYINPWNFLKKSAQMIWNGVKGAVTTVVNVTKKIGQAVGNVAKKVGQGIKKGWRGFCSIFGRSAFILDIDSGTILGYIRGGKGGEKLCNERYIVEQFGPILTANAIGAMAHDVHKHYKSCVDAQDDERVKSCAEVYSEERELNEKTKEGLDELKGRAEELAEKLTIEADKVLTVKEVCIKVDDGGRNISVEWFVYNPEEDTFYNEDNGDIEYHVTITAIVIDGDNVKNVSIYDDIFISKIEDEEEGDAPNDKKNENAIIATKPQMTEAMQDSSMLHTKEGQDATEMTKTISHHAVETTQDEMVEKRASSCQINLPLITEIAQGNEVPEEEPAYLTELKGEQQLEDRDADGKETYYDKKRNVQFDNQNQLPILISLQHPFDPEIIENTVYICASIQPRVTLQVKMLPPDKIATEEYRIDQERLQDGDTLWMDDTKQEIEENGRINEVTLEGKRVCEQQLIKPYLDPHLGSKVRFTAQCHYQEDSLTVSGDITPVPEADYYLVQLMDETDLTVIIKQCQLLPPKLHYEMKALCSDFPETSSGPYHVSIIALHADLGTCSAFTNSELKITRYCSPVGLTETLPNLDSSNSDIVRLEWKYPKSSKQESKEDVSEYAPVTTVTSDSQEKEIVLNRMPVESAHFDTLADIPEQSIALDPQGGDHGKSTEYAASELSNLMLSQTCDHFYTITITGVHIKKLNASDVVSIENIKSSDKAFSLSVPVHAEQDSHEQSVGYEFSLVDILKKKQHKLQDGLLFQCQVLTNGASRLHSMPKSFADFILLAPPMDLKVTTPVRRAGLHIGWEYSAHAIGYRIELVDEYTKERAFTKDLKCETGSHGEVVLYKTDFKNIPCTSIAKGYQVQMYSLGFGQELIRCLDPSVAEGTFHVIPAELQYLNESNMVRVKFRPFTSVKAEYVVQLCRVTGDDTDEPYHLTTRKIYDHEVLDETVRDFPLKKWWQSLQSGDLVTAWICSTVTTDRDHGITYIGIPQEEVCVMDSPKLKTSPIYHSDGTISDMKLTWSEVMKAQQYQYGCYLPDKNEYIALKETQEKEATISFNSSLVEQLCDIACEFQLYITALGQPGALVAGELTLDTVRLQYIKSISLKEHKTIVFTSISLQQVWKEHLANHTFSRYYVPLVVNPQHILFPSGEPFPHLNIPRKFMKRFWKTEFSLFGNGE